MKERKAHRGGRRGKKTIDHTALYLRAAERLALVRQNTATVNRIKAHQRTFPSETGSEFAVLLKRHRKESAAMLRQTEKKIEELAQLHEQCVLLRQVAGLKSWNGFAVILSRIKNVERFKSVSALWRFCGFAVINGAAERRMKKQKLHFDPVVQVAWWQLSISLVRPGGPWRAEYLRLLDFEQAKRKHRAGKRAIRKVIKEILKRFYVLGTKRDWKPMTCVQPCLTLASKRRRGQHGSESQPNPAPSPHKVRSPNDGLQPNLSVDSAGRPCELVQPARPMVSPTSSQEAAG